MVCQTTDLMRKSYLIAPLAGLFITGLLGLLLIPIWWMPYAEYPAQAASYHLFADSQAWGPIPNGGNVLSNLPFVVVGLWGLLSLASTKKEPGRIRFGWEWQAFSMMFAFIILTGVGSAYYHWAPSSDSLFWDRMPMAILFAGAMTTIIRGYRSIGRYFYLLKTHMIQKRLFLRQMG